jgi:hypothetical protein
LAPHDYAGFEDEFGFGTEVFGLPKDEICQSSWSDVTDEVAYTVRDSSIRIDKPSAHSHTS